VVDVRILAATNQDLDQLIEQGRFRKDLYYRLRGVTIHLPPLRERREDIPELAHYFLFRFNRELGSSVQSISLAALERLEMYDWPGNVRQLQSAIRETLIVSAGPMVLPEFLPAEFHRESSPESDTEPQVGPVSQADWRLLPELVETAVAQGEKDVYRRALQQFDRLVIASIMRQAGGQQSRAAEILGLSRVTLRSKLRQMQLAVEKVLTEKEREFP
jgi:two-component system nitrogen regulation response regulator GlnG